MFLASGCQKAVVTGDLAITNTNVIDVRTGEVHSAQDVIIRGDSIYDILSHGTATLEATQTIDGVRQYLIPGLWDMHVHSWWGYQDFFPVLVANGITGIREMWGNVPEVRRIAKLIEEDSIIGPEMITAAAIVDGNPPAWEGSDIADTPETGREIVRRQKDEGADFIKVYTLLERDAYFAIADESRRQNIPFSGHIPKRVSLQEALEAGHGSIEHFYGIPEFCSSQQDYLEKLRKGDLENDTLMGLKFSSWYHMADYIYDTFDEAREYELRQLMEKHKPWICPTLVVHIGGQRNYDPLYVSDERIDYMPGYTMNGWRTNASEKSDSISRLNLQTERNAYKIITKLLKPVKDAGARILAGSDYPNPFTFPGFSLHEELQLLVDDAGFTPLEALQTATLNPALFLGLENGLGTVGKGKIANLVLLAENPLDDIRNTTKINAVILRGTYHEGSILRESIESIATNNRKPKIADEIGPLILEEGIDAGIRRYHELRDSRPDAYNFDEEQLNTLGYDLLEAGYMEEAIRIFSLNTEVFPEYANGFDSLGDGFMAAGDPEGAKKAWQRAVDLGMLVTKDKLQSLD